MDEKEQKEHNEHIDLVSAILTSAYIVNTKKDIEDLTESLKIFREFRGKYFDRLREWGDVKENETGNLIAALLTAGYIVNTMSKEETVNETIDLLDMFRRGYFKLLETKPEPHERKRGHESAGRRHNRRAYRQYRKVGGDPLGDSHRRIRV